MSVHYLPGRKGLQGSLERPNPIGWCHATWNVMSGGCDPPCPYCWARATTRRFKRFFPFGWEPTAWLEDLTAPQKVKEPMRIFPCAVTDVMGSQWPREDVQKVIDACRAAPQHTFLFLTKRPWMYVTFEWPDNCWLGATVTSREEWRLQYRLVGAAVEARGNSSGLRTFLSIEPMLDGIGKVIEGIDWVIVGPMTGAAARSAGYEAPTKEEFDELVRAVGDRPLWVKEAGSRLWDGHPAAWCRELPAGVARSPRESDEGR